MDKIAMFGGAFDPIHNGHLHLAAECVEQLGLDRLLLVPTCRSPHKAGERTASPQQRLEMCRLALQGLPQAEVSDMEIRRGGKSYTVDTLRTLNQTYPGARLYLLMGADMFLTMREWRAYEDILRLAVLCPMARGEVSAEQLREEAERLGAQTEIVDLPPMTVSSTEIRRRMAEGQPVGDMLPREVERYIQAQGLYRM